LFALLGKKGADTPYQRVPSQKGPADNYNWWYVYIF